MYRLIDLFCGAGGMTLGFVDPRLCGGFESVSAIDHDAASVRTHIRNFGPHAERADIEERLSRPIPEADVVIGGPPCQGFSLLNKKRLGDERRSLWRPYMDIVERSGARMFVIENVVELLGSSERVDIIDHATRLGFDTVFGVLHAADHGAPQSRRRAVILGWRPELGAPPVFPPPPTHAAPDSGSPLPAWRTVRDAIGDLPAPLGTEIRSEPPPLDLHFGRTPTRTSLERYRAVPSGGNRFDLQRERPDITPDCWIRKTSGGTDLFGRLWWDRPSVTIRTEFFKPEKGRYLHPVADRSITHREAARLMGFPDDFVFEGTKTEIARQIGNAVPPPLAGAVARVVRAFLDQVGARAAA